MTTEADIPHGTYNGYCNYHCRCDDCRSANSDYVRKLRKRSGLSPSHEPMALAQRKATRWVRENHPDVWQELVNAAYDELEIERRPPGRPR